MCATHFSGQAKTIINQLVEQDDKRFCAGRVFNIFGIIEVLPTDLLFVHMMYLCEHLGYYKAVSYNITFRMIVHINFMRIIGVFLDLS